MERKIIAERIGDILDELGRLSNTLHAMNTTDIQRYPDNYEILSADAALRGEKIACRLRHLLYSCTGIKKTDYLKSAALIQGIQIEFENGVLTVTVPSLFTKRKLRGSLEFIIDPLYAALEQYADSHPMPKYEHCVVCFSHIYNRQLPQRRVRDYDNLELKQILDAISTYIMTDDNGLLCDAYNTTELGETDCTKIAVMDKDSFMDWLEERKNRLKDIWDF